MTGQPGIPPRAAPDSDDDFHDILFVAVFKGFFICFGSVCAALCLLAIVSTILHFAGLYR